jgi:hypothetical protein
MMSDRVQYLSPPELSDRWEGRITVKTLANWRSPEARKAPPFRKFGNRILYPLPEVEAWERSQEWPKFEPLVEWAAGSQAPGGQSAKDFRRQVGFLEHEIEQRRAQLAREQRLLDEKAASLTGEHAERYAALVARFQPHPSQF